MPSLFKSVTIAYRDRKGRKCKKGGPGARKVRIVSKSWYGRYKDADDKTVTEPLCPDKASSKQMLAKLVSDAKTKQLYPPTPVSEQEWKLREAGQRPLSDHLEDFRRYLTARGDAAKYVRGTCSQVRAVLDGCRFVAVADLESAAVVEFLAELRGPEQPVTLEASKETFTTSEVAALLGVKTEAVGRRAVRFCLA